MAEYAKATVTTSSSMVAKINTPRSGYAGATDQENETQDARLSCPKAAIIRLSVM